MKLSIIDIITLSGYLLLMAAMGFYFSRKNKNTEEYFVGGRSFPGWAIGLSMVGTSISSITFLAYPADAFKTSWIRFIPNLALPFAIIVASCIFLPFFRRGKCISAYEYLENRFGPSIRLYASLAFMISQLVRVSVILYLVSLLFHEIIGLSPVQCIFIAGVCVSLYTIVGGIDAVIWTDVLQTIILAFGGVICLIVIISKLPGGLGQIFSVAQEYDKLSFSELVDGQLKPISWGLSISKKTGLMMFFLGITTWLTEYCGNQVVVQRYFASKSTHEARKAMWIAVCSSLPIWAFYMFLGTAIFVFFRVFPDMQTQAMLDGTARAEQVLPYFIINYLPSGLIGITIAAALAAAMSSLDSSINSISTIAVNDIYGRFIMKNKSDRHYLRVAWVIATIAALLMICGAIVLVNADTKTLQDTGAIIASILGGGLLGIYMLGFFTSVGDARAVGVGIIFTTGFTVWTLLMKSNYLPEYIKAPFDLYYTIIFGNIIMFFTGLIMALLFPRKNKLAQELTVWKANKK